MKLWWVEQRYVVPVVAESLDEALEIAFENRRRISRECGGDEREARRLYDSMDGWENCVPFGKSNGKTLLELKEAGIK